MFISLSIGNDNTIEVLGLKNGLTGAFVNNAIVAATLTDVNNNPVTGQSFPVTLNYVADSDGEYRAVLEDTLVLTDGEYYTIEVAVAGDGLTARETKQVQATQRRF